AGERGTVQAPRRVKDEASDAVRRPAICVVEGMEERVRTWGARTADVQLEHRASRGIAGTAVYRCAIESTMAGVEHYAGNWAAIRRREIVQHGVAAVRAQLEDDAVSPEATPEGGAIEVPGVVAYQAGLRLLSIVIGRVVEAVQDVEATCGGHPV